MERHSVFMNWNILFSKKNKKKKYIIFKIIILPNEIYEIYRFSAVTRKYQQQFCRQEKHQL